MAFSNELVQKIKEARENNHYLITVTIRGQLNQYFTNDFPKDEIKRCLCHIFDDYFTKDCKHENIKDTATSKPIKKEIDLIKALEAAEDSDKYFISITIQDQKNKDNYNHYWSRNRFPKGDVVRCLNGLIDEINENSLKRKWK